MTSFLMCVVTDGDLPQENGVGGMSTSHCSACEPTQACGAYHVYVVELAAEVALLRKFAAANPEMQDYAKCYYVGMTLHLPACRLQQHRSFYAGDATFLCPCFTEGRAVERSFMGRGPNGRTRGVNIVGRYGIHLRGRLFKKFNAVASREEAEALERWLTRDLRRRGLGAWSDGGCRDEM
jgi:hypothetical protein